MSNKFLGTTGAEIDVTNGTVPLYGSTLGAKSLKPSYPIKTNSASQLVSSKLFISDVENLQQKLNSAITNPYAGDLRSNSFVSNNIYDTTRTSNINLSNDTINIVSESVKINGETVITAGTNVVQNPMVEDLNCNDNNLTNVGLINGFDIVTITNDMAQVKAKTFYINEDLSPSGTIFSNSIYADKFIINGVTTPAYLLSDGSTIAVSGQNSQSNIYLYRNSTVNVSPPDVGEVRFNNPSNILTTTLWISHITHGANGVDIDVFLALITSVSIIYLQEADNSLNYIKYNVTANPVIIENNYITLQVSTLSSGGSGATNFGNVDLIMSIFTNDTEIDGRITAVETKTQNIEATSSKLTVSRSTELLIDENDFFAIRSIDGFLNYLVFNPTEMNLYTNLNINANDLENVGSIKISGFESSNFFIKTDGTIDENDYIQATDTVITDLQNKTQNITASPVITTIEKSSQFRLSSGNTFSITDDSGPFIAVTKLLVTNTQINAQIPMSMNTYKLNGITNPVDNDDAVNKSYVDGLISPLQVKTQNLTANSLFSSFIKTVQFNIADGEAFGIASAGGISINKFVVNNTSVQASIPITATSFIRSGGLTTQFLKANGDVDSSTYLTAVNVANKLNVDGTIAMTGALNMGGQAINNSGIISAAAFVKNGGIVREFLKANGGSDARIMSNLQAVQSNFQVGINGILTETNITANPDAGSYTWTDLAVGFSRRWKFHAICTRTGSTDYTMRFKSNLGTMITWVLPALNTPATNQMIEITVTATRRLNTTINYYGKWDSSDTGTNQNFWLNTGTNTNVPDLANGGNYSVSFQSNNPNANITFLYIEVQNIYNG